MASVSSRCGAPRRRGRRRTGLDGPAAPISGSTRRFTPFGMAPFKGNTSATSLKLFEGLSHNISYEAKRAVFRPFVDLRRVVRPIRLWITELSAWQTVERAPTEEGGLDCSEAYLRAPPLGCGLAGRRVIGPRERRGVGRLGLSDPVGRAPIHPVRPSTPSRAAPSPGGFTHRTRRSVSAPPPRLARVLLGGRPAR